MRGRGRSGAVGKVSDSLTERYDFTVAVPAATAPVADAKEHVLAVRVYDRYEECGRGEGGRSLMPGWLTARISEVQPRPFAVGGRSDRDVCICRRGRAGGD